MRELRADDVVQALAPDEQPADVRGVQEAEVDRAAREAGGGRGVTEGRRARGVRAAELVPQGAQGLGELELLGGEERRRCAGSVCAGWVARGGLTGVVPCFLVLRVLDAFGVEPGCILEGFFQDAPVVVLGGPAA